MGANFIRVADMFGGIHCLDAPLTRSSRNPRFRLTRGVACGFECEFGRRSRGIRCGRLAVTRSSRTS
eukprot:5205336-Pyramimonas_sp.AAC.1